MSNTRIFASALSALVLSLCLTAEVAYAHATLLASNPRVSATLTKAPKSITLVFDDDLLPIPSGNVVEVKDPKGRKADAGSTVLNGASVSAALKSLKIFGKYTVIYHVVSADGHPVTGTYFFYFKKRK